MYELRCLGEATLRSPTGQLVHFRSRKHFALLAYLAMNAGRAHRRERLAGLLWSESDDTRARHSLSQALYAVRRLLNDAVRIQGEDLELNSDGLHVDALELERRLQAGDVTTAADLYRGDFLEGFWVRGAHGFDEWAGRERARVGALARDALRESIRSARDRCDWPEVRKRAERLADLDPFDEAAYAELMRACWMLGDRSDALERYEDLKKVLAAELQASPSSETQALAERIRRRPVRGGWSSGSLLRESAGGMLQDPPFVGRQDELAQLAAEWHRVRRGETRTVALVGAAGIGKTRLADEFINGLELNDLTVLRGCCYEAEQTLPYGPVAEGLRQGAEVLDLSDVNPLWLAELARIVPEVRDRYDDLPEPAVLDAEGSRRRLYEGIAQVLTAACEVRPTLLFVDDLHWADDSSLSLLHYLHRRVTNGLYLLIAYRPEELTDDDSATSPTLLSIRNRRVHTIHLDGLDSSASGDLLVALLGQDRDAPAVATVRDMSGGNPFFAIELARSLAEDEGGGRTRPPIPESIRKLLERRFARLSERSVAFLQQAACLGSRVSQAALRSGVGLAPYEFNGVLRELARADILSAEEGLVRFRHDLIREVAWSRVPVALHGALHLRAARALINVSGSDGEIAVHLAAANDDRRAYAYALRGADTAEEIFALEEAADLLELAITRAPNAESRARLVARLGKLYLHMRDYKKARPFLEERLVYARQRQRPKLEEFEARRDILLLDMWSSKRNLEASARELEALYVEVKESGLEAPVLQADILTKLFWAAARSFNPSLAEATVQEIRRIHSEFNQPAVRCRTGRSLGIYECYRGSLDTAEQYLTDALNAAKAADDPIALIDCYVGLTTLLPRLIRVDLAEHILKTALPLAEQYADPWHITAILCNCAVPYMYAHNARRAKDLLGRAQQSMLSNGDVPDTSPSVLYNLGFVANVSGDTETAHRYWTAALEASDRDGVLPVQQEALAALGALALERGQMSRARDLAARALRLARRGQFLVDERFGLQSLLARLRYLAGHERKSLTKLDEVAASARNSDVPLYLTAKLTRLQLTLQAGKNEEALRVKRELCDVAETQGVLWWAEQAELLSRSRRSRGSPKRSLQV